LAIIRASIQPKRPHRIMRPKMTSDTSSIYYLKYTAFVPFMIIPILIWNMAMMTEIFILMTLMN
jgi:hypothetical protein